MEKYYSFAGICFSVSMPSTWMYTEESVLKPFRTDAREDVHKFVYEMVDRLTSPEGVLVAELPNELVYETQYQQIRYIGAIGRNWENAHMRVCHRGRMHFVQLKKDRYTKGVSVQAVLNALSAEHLMAQNGTVALHASYVIWGGKAILFTAPSGTGKSTQAELWRTLRGAEVINGDRAAIQLEAGVPMVEAIPFSGSSGICKNYRAPLAAVVYLAQAPQTEIRRMKGFEAFRYIWEGVSVNTWDKADMLKVSETVQQIAQYVSVYFLACLPDESAVMAVEKAIGEANKHA